MASHNPLDYVFPTKKPLERYLKSAPNPQAPKTSTPTQVVGTKQTYKNAAAYRAAQQNKKLKKRKYPLSRAGGN